MRKITSINESKLDVRNEINYFVPADKLEKYLKITANNKSISDETRNICNWLIDHNDEYIKMFGKKGLVSFYDKGVPSDPKLKDLYKWIGTLYKNHRLLECPTFQTEDEFESILDKSVNVDSVVLDFNTEQGRNEIAKKFIPLAHKIAAQFDGKSSMTRDELFSSALNGITWAIASYGKKNRKELAKEMETGTEVDVTRKTKISFVSYCAWMMRGAILDDIKNNSNLVRIPTSRQSKIKKEKGSIGPQTVSGDQPMGRHDDGSNKSLFDVVGGSEDPYKNIDHLDIDTLWKEILDAVKEKFPEKEYEIYCKRWGLRGYDEVGVHELAKTYGYKSDGSITAIVNKINTWALKDKTVGDKLRTVFELMTECRKEEDAYDVDLTEPAHVSESNTNNANTLDD